MAKDQMVSDFVQAVQDGQKQVLSDEGGKLYDGAFQEGVASVPPSVGSDPSKIFSQSDLDAAVQAQKDADAQADAQLKADFEALAEKEKIEADKIEKLKALLFS